MIGSLVPFTISAGHLCVYLLGSCLPLHLLLIVLVTGPCSVFILFYLIVPKSPVWLMKSGQEDECKDLLHRLRGDQYLIEQEFQELQNLINIQRKDAVGWSAYKSKSFYYPLFLVSSIFLLYSLIGYINLSDYSLFIFKYPDINVSTYTIAILFQLVLTVSSIPAPILMVKLGRRAQLITGCLSVLICFILLGAYHIFYYSGLHPVFAYAPLVLLLIFGLSFGLLIAPIPYTLASELFPQHLKSHGSTVGMSLHDIGAFLANKLFPVVKGWVGMAGVYMIHGIVALVLAILTFCLLPETRNKTYTQLDILFKTKANQVEPSTNV